MVCFYECILKRGKGEGNLRHENKRGAFSNRAAGKQERQRGFDTAEHREREKTYPVRCTDPVGSPTCKALMGGPARRCRFRPEESQHRFSDLRHVLFELPSNKKQSRRCGISPPDGRAERRQHSIPPHRKGKGKAHLPRPSVFYGAGAFRRAVHSVFPA